MDLFVVPTQSILQLDYSCKPLKSSWAETTIISVTESTCAYDLATSCVVANGVCSGIFSSPFSNFFATFAAK